MPVVNPYQSGFSSGELSPRYAGRPDTERYKTGLDLCENYVVTTQGGLIRRPGTYFAAEVKDSSARVRLIPFEFSTTQAYVIEAGNQYLRFYRNQALVTFSALTITGATKANPCVITSNAHGYSNGDRVVITGVGGMVELNNREFTVAGVTANTFQLSGVNSSAYTTYTSGGSVAKIYELATTYLTADLPTLKWVQSADVLFIVHPSYPPRKLTRTGHTSWTITDLSFRDGPYLPENTVTATTIQAGATTGSVTLLASAAVFVSTDVGRSVRLKINGSWGWTVITAYTSSTQVTATVQEGSLGGSGIPTSQWRLGLYGTAQLYPSCVAIHQDRLVLSGCPARPHQVDFSRTGDYEYFAPTDLTSSANVTDSHAISVSLATGGVNGVRWMDSDEKGLILGTAAAEHLARPRTDGSAITPTDIDAPRVTKYGSANIQPVRAGKSLLFAQRASRKLREIGYFYDADGFRADDLTVLSEHMTLSKIREIAWQQEPIPIAWVVREDGVLVGLTYERGSDVLRAGWHRHKLGGVSDAAGNPPVVESIAVIPSTDESRNEVWLVVRRLINGATERYVEWMKPYDDLDTEQHDAFFVDAGISMDTPVAISAVTKASPAQVTTGSAHGLSTNDYVYIAEIKGMDQLNGGRYQVTVSSATVFTLNGTDSTAFTTYVSGGNIWKQGTAFSGVFHLAGETVDVCGDGAAQAQTTISSTGAVTLSQSAGVAHVGLPITAKAKLPRLDAGSARGSAVGLTRRAHRVALVLLRAGCMEIGYDDAALTEITFRDTDDQLDRAVPLFTGDHVEEVDADYGTQGKLVIQQSEPLPGTILGVVQHLGVNDR